MLASRVSAEFYHLRLACERSLYRGLNWFGKLAHAFAADNSSPVGAIDGKSDEPAVSLDLRTKLLDDFLVVGMASASCTDSFI